MSKQQHPVRPIGAPLVRKNDEIAWWSGEVRFTGIVARCDERYRMITVDAVTPAPGVHVLDAERHSIEGARISQTDYDERMAANEPFWQRS